MMMENTPIRSCVLERGPETLGLVAAALLLLLPGHVAPASGQEAAARSAPTAREAMTRLGERYGPEVAERIREVVRSAEDAGAPAGPILNKALEGAAKAVPPDRLLPVLREYGERLARVRSLVGGGPPTGAVVAGANALRQGVPGEAVREMVHTSGGQATMALVALGELSASGVPVDGARALVGEALERGAGGADLLSLSAAVRQLVARGRAPGEALGAIHEAVRQGRPPSSVPGVGNPPGGPPGGGPPGGTGGGPPSGAGPPAGGGGAPPGR